MKRPASIVNKLAVLKTLQTVYDVITGYAYLKLGAVNRG